LSCSQIALYVDDRRTDEGRLPDDTDGRRAPVSSRAHQSGKALTSTGCFGRIGLAHLESDGIERVASSQEIGEVVVNPSCTDALFGFIPIHLHAPWNLAVGHNGVTATMRDLQ
jgi:hypothetical protein